MKECLNSQNGGLILLYSNKNNFFFHGKLSVRLNYNKGVSRLGSSGTLDKRSCDDDREEQFLAAKKMKWALTVAFVISKAMGIEKLQIPI